MKKKVAVLFFLAGLIRFINLDQSLWLDEAVVAKVIRTIPFHLIPIRFSPGDFHPPFYYMFMSLWSSVFGYSEIALRIPSVIASLLTGWMVYKIGLLIADKNTALWACVFFLFNPLILYYSQEARMYMMITFFLTTALYFFIDLIQNKDGIQISKVKGQSVKVFLFILFIVLSIFTFYGSIFFIVTLIVYALILRKLKIASLLITSVILSVLLLSPLLIQQLQTAKGGLIDVKNWSLVLGKANLKNLLLVFIKFTSGRLSWNPKVTYYLIVGSWSIVVWMLVLIGMIKNKLLSYLFIIPLVIAFLISFYTPMLQYFRFLYLIPVMSLLLAKGISLLSHYIDAWYIITKTRHSGKSRLVGRIQNLILDNHVWCQNDGVSRTPQFIKSSILLFYLIFSFVYLLNPSFHREDWKSLSGTLDLRKPVYMIVPSSDAVLYYRNNVIIKEIREISQKKRMEKYIYVIPYVTEIYGFDYKKTLIDKGCVISKQQVFRELLLEEWACDYLAVIK